MSASEPIKDTEAYRDSIATVDEQGKRIWLYPKKPKGKFTNYRTYLSWVLLIVLFGMPFLKVDGEPFMMFNVLTRNFIVFGVHFVPQDFYLFVLAMLTFIVFIVLFTVIFGRLFCGWVCPQTIFMEMVFRKIEYAIEGDANAQRRLNKAPWTTNKIFKKTTKQIIFYLLAILIANTFLSYIIGVDEVGKIISDPIQQHMGGFIAMLIFSAVFYGVFAFMREQVCIAVCPYGRLQSVLLDENSVVVAYDYLRGEPRGKIKKKPVAKKNPLTSIQASVASPMEKIATQLGDCIDCKMCVNVCPTGIDIRNGTQLECVNCTACIDACDEIMEKVDRPLGLIRYDSEKGIREGKKKIFTYRVMAYSAVLVALLVLQGFLLANRNDVDVLLLKSPGTLYQEVNETTLSNLYDYQIINKTAKVFPIEFRLKGGIGEIKIVGSQPLTVKNGVSKGVIFIELPKDKLTGHSTEFKVEILSKGIVIDELTTNFLGPEK
jgi:cytochrome c oxidase accessory protein FixG